MWETCRQAGSFPPAPLFYSGKSKCKMIPFNKGSHLNALRRGEEREQAGRCISCFDLNGNFNGSRPFPPKLALVQSCFCSTYLAVQWDLVTGDAVGLQVSCTAFVFACLSLFSVADIHANGFHSSLLSFEGCIVRSGNTMSVRGICSYILQRSMKLHWCYWMDESYECPLCRVHVLWDQDEIRKLAHDVSADLHTVCSNRISSTRSITFSFPSAALPSYILSHHSPLSVFLQCAAICANL